MRRNSILFLALSFLPCLVLGFLIAQTAVNTPLADQWLDPGPMIIKAVQGDLSFQDLFDQYNESRLFFPTLFFIGLAYLTHWNTKYEVWTIFLMVCFFAFSVYRFSQLTVKGHEIKRLLILLFANLIIFSPIQWENWLSGVQVAVFMPIACLFIALLIFGSKKYFFNHFRAKFFSGLCLCTISTFSFASGGLLWLILLPPLFFYQTRSLPDLKKELITKKYFIALWVLCLIAEFTAYFNHYQKPINHPSFTTALERPFEAVQFFLVFLGNSLGTNDLVASQIWGGVFLGVFLVSIFRYGTQVHQIPSLTYCVIPWLSIAAYSLLSAFIADLGRLGFGLVAALASRYAIFSALFMVSTLYLAAIVFNPLPRSRVHFSVMVVGADNAKRFRFTLSIKAITKTLVLLFAVVLLISHNYSFSYGVSKLYENKQERLMGKACLLFIEVVYPNECAKKLIPNHYTYLLNDLGFIHPKLVETRNILNLSRQSNQKTDLTYGYWEEVDPAGENRTDTFSGWAILPDRKEPAHAVVLASESPDGAVVPFAIAEVFGKRKDVAKQLSNSRYRRSGWSIRVPLKQRPSDLSRISAWAIEAESGRVFRLKNAPGLSVAK